MNNIVLAALAFTPHSAHRNHQAALVSSLRSVPTTPLLSAAAGTSGSTAEEEDKGASLTSMVPSLVKSLVGSGVLVLPRGIAAFSGSRTALLPAIALLATIGTISAYCFTLVARVCEETGSSSWGEAWSRSVGNRTAWIPSLFVSLICLSACLSCARSHNIMRVAGQSRSTGS